MLNIKDANQNVLTLVSSLNAQVVDYVDSEKVGVVLNDYIKSCFGFYHFDLDVILINSNKYFKEHSIDETILHEIMHWTGNKNRLNRSVVQAWDKNAYITPTEMAQEEAIAQIGMYLLATYLGFDEKEYSEKKDKYLKKYPLADLEEAEKEARIAFNYLTNPEISKVA